MNKTIVLRVLLVIALGTLAACLIYPLIYHLVIHIWGWDYGPDRIFRRIWMISVVLGLVGCGRWLGFRHPAEVGYQLHPGMVRNLAIGTAIAWAFLMSLCGAYLALGAWRAQQEYELIEGILTGLVRGALVAGIEEYIFRGLIFFSLRAHWGWIKAAVFCSLIFSSLHFLEGHKIDTDIDPGVWWMGFYQCAMLTGNMIGGITLVPDAVSLFVVGMILCYAAQKTGSLWYSVGLHGGWVWAAAVLSETMSRAPDVETVVIGGNRMFDGYIPFAGMFIIFPITAWLIHKRWVLMDERLSEGAPSAER